MKNDELVEHLLENHRVRILPKKEWSDFTWIEWIPDEEIWVLEETKREGGWEKERQLGDGWNERRWESWYLILQMLKWSDPLEERHTGEKKLKWQTRWSRRISIHIGVWEHHLGKVWNQHLTLKQLESHNSKQKQRVGLQNKPEQTYDRDFVRSFRGGAYTGSIVQHHHVQGSAHDIRSVPESA